MEDGEGRLIDFKNTIILLTTNVGSDLIMNLCKDPEFKPDVDGIAKALQPAYAENVPGRSAWPAYRRPLLSAERSRC